MCLLLCVRYAWPPHLLTRCRAIAQSNARLLGDRVLDPTKPVVLTVERLYDKHLVYQLSCEKVVLARLAHTIPQSTAPLPPRKTETESTTTASSTVPVVIKYNGVLQACNTCVRKGVEKCNHVATPPQHCQNFASRVWPDDPTSRIESSHRPTLNLTPEELAAPPTVPQRTRPQPKSLNRLVVKSDAHYAFMMMTTLDVSYIGHSPDPYTNVAEHNTRKFVGRQTATHAPHWRLDTVIGPFATQAAALECATTWLKGVRGVEAKRSKAVILARDVYDTDCYIRADVIGRITVEHTKSPLPVVPELEAKTPQPYASVPLVLPSPRRRWNGRVVSPFIFPLIDAYNRAHPVTPTAQAVKDSEKRLQERLEEMGHKQALAEQLYQTEQKRLERRLGDMVVAKAEARHAHEKELTTRDAQIRELSESVRSYEKYNTIVCQDNERHRKQVRELRELCAAQESELLTLRESDEAQERALQQLRERNAFLERHMVDSVELIARMQQLLLLAQQQDDGQ